MHCTDDQMKGVPNKVDNEYIFIFNYNWLKVIYPSETSRWFVQFHVYNVETAVIMSNPSHSEKCHQQTLRKYKLSIYLLHLIIFNLCKNLFDVVYLL